MEITKINAVYFSATYSTKKIVDTVIEGLGNFDVKRFDITKGYKSNTNFNTNELAIFGIPVYAGRVPHIAAEALKMFKGNNTPLIIMCVYGNRDYDDALLELKDIAENNGFKILSAGVFIAQHSIFPKVANKRPDDKDRLNALDFGKDSIKKLKEINRPDNLPELKVKGNFPYKIAKSIPLKPRGDRKCNECGTCVRLCPTGAIKKDNPRKTIKEKCISCARCITVCPQKSRQFRGILYRLVANKFQKKYAQQKNNEVFI